MKKVLISAMLAAASLGLMGSADAASGYVNVEAVLASSPAFVQAEKSFVAELQKLQKEFNEKSKSMSDKDKQALAQKMNQQLAQYRAQIMGPIQTKFRAAIEKAAKAKDVDMVVNNDSVVYGGVDLTQDVKANMK